MCTSADHFDYLIDEDTQELDMTAELQREEE